MEIRLACAKSIVDMENIDHPEVVMGAPAAIVERVGVDAPWSPDSVLPICTKI